MTDSHRIARDLLAAMTDDEAAAFVTDARTPRNDSPDELEFVRGLFGRDPEPDEHDGGDLAGRNLFA